MRTIIHWSLVLAMLTGSSVANQQDPAAIDLEAAIRTETIDGNLEAAIAQYEQIAETSNRAIAAEALMRMGGAYEKLGSEEAQRAYQRVVSEYADQGAVVAQAQTRLSSLVQTQIEDTPPALSLRQVWTPPDGADPFENRSSISPDGRYLTYTDWTTGNLGIHDKLDCSAVSQRPVLLLHYWGLSIR